MKDSVFVRSFTITALFTSITIFSLSVGGCKKKKKEASTEKADKATKEIIPWPSPKLLWKSPFSGTVRPLEIHRDKALALSYRVKRHWAAPSRVVAFNLKTGKLLWDERKAPNMMVRTAPWSVSYGISCAEERCFLAYQRQNSWVYGLDLSTGDAIWRERGAHGVGVVDEGFVVSQETRLSIRGADTGRELRHIDLSDPKTGALPNGVKSALTEGTVVQVLDQGYLITREDGGELQLLDKKSGKLKWRFRQKGELGDRILNLPMADEKLLVPAVFPDKERGAELASWPMDTTSTKPTWRLSLNGRVRGSGIKGNKESILLRAAEKGDRDFLVRVDRKTGKKLSRVQMPGVRHCVPGPPNKYICRTGNDISTFESSTGKLLWKNNLGSERKRVQSVWWAGQWVAAETADKLWILSTEDGKKVTTYKKELKDARINVNAVLAPTGDILPLVVRTFQEYERLDRRYLVGLNTKTGESAYEIRLGIPSRSRRDNRISYRERRLGVPVLFVEPTEKEKEPRIFSASGNTVRLIKAADGEKLKEFKMPGDDKRSTALISENNGVVLVEHGELMLAIDINKATILWRKHVGSQEALLQNGGEALLKDDRGEHQLLSQKGAEPLPKELLEHLGYRRYVVAYMTDKFFIVRSGGKVEFFNRERKEITGSLDGNWYFYGERDNMLAVRHVQRKGGGGTFVGIDIEKGKPSWKREPGENPEVDPVPEPVRRERQWPVNWIRSVPTLETIKGAEGAFIMTDSSGKCVVAIEPESGKLRWTLCFGKLTGLPVFAKGYILLAAHGPAMKRKGLNPSQKSSTKNHKAKSEDNKTKDIQDSSKAKTDEEKPPEGSQLYAVKVSTGKPKLVYTAPPGWEVFLGTAKPDSEDRLLITLAPLGKTTKKDHLAALSLWGKKE